VYCLANDRHLEWFIAFCESLRVHEPLRRLLVIPFDANVTRLAALSDRYQFTMFWSPVLADLDELGKRLWPSTPTAAQTLRKLAAFWGPAERFLYLDADVVVLRPLDALFQSFDPTTHSLVHCGSRVEQTYKPGHPRESMLATNPATGVQTGAFLSKRDALRLADLDDVAREAIDVRDSFADTYEQPFISYWVDLQRIDTAYFHEVCPTVACGWAGAEMNWTEDGLERVVEGIPRLVAFIHWAGFPLSPRMPYRNEFLYYRLHLRPPASRLIYKLNWFTRAAVTRGGRALVRRRGAGE
jgi:hypothetical protein